MADESPLSGIQLFNQSGKALPLTLDDIQTVSQTLAKGEKLQFSLLEVVYVDQKEIVRINREYLERDYITDIITFRYDEELSNQAIEGTLFCCAPRIYEQALELNQDPEKEFKRILIHGMLHLCGYKDDTNSDKKRMSEKEDYYLDQLE